VHFFQNKDKKQAVHNLADSYKQTENTALVISKYWYITADLNEL